MPRPASGTRPGRPPRTSRAEILSAARRVIDRDGWQQLTIRRLAAEVGTAPTTLYHHVRDKEDLLAQLLNDDADRVPHPELPDDPRTRIVVAATVMHQVLAARPWIAELLTADDLYGDSALWMVEAIVAGAVDAGCPPEQAVHVYRHIWYFTAGEVLVRANSARRRDQLDRPVYRDERFRHLDPSRFPHLAELAERWPALTAEDTYLQGLLALIDGSLPSPA